MPSRIARSLGRARLARRLRTVCRLPFRILTSSARVLPSFLIIGVQKGGTTSLFAYLNSHPKVRQPLLKECHFFDFRFDLGVPLYRACFPRGKEMERLRGTSASAAHCGEASPYYIYDPQVPGRVKALLPNARLILLLRSPVERAFSHYRHNKVAGYETRSFARAVEEELDAGPEACLRARALKAHRNQHHRRFSYLTRGLYLDQIRDWHACFSRTQLLILRSEDFFENTPAQFDKVLSFLELERWRPEKGFRPHNVGVSDALDERVSARLLDFYGAPNRRLHEYLQTDRQWWPERQPRVTVGG